MTLDSVTGKGGAHTGVVAPSGRKQAELAILEYGETDLPIEIIRRDGTFELYGDVQTKFEISYKRKKNKLVIRGGGWIGYLPINGQYALRVETRVPVKNLEKILARCTSTRIEIFERYCRSYGESYDKPQSLFDVMTDSFLAALDQIWRDGLAKGYQRKGRQSFTPHGRIDPFRTAIGSLRTRQPTAYYSAFFRTADFFPNRVIKTALMRLLISYTCIDRPDQDTQRIRRIRDSAMHLTSVQGSNKIEHSPSQIDQYVRHLPEQNSAYISALRIASLIIRNLGIGIRQSGREAQLPAILVDMADIFERYVRETLKEFEQEFGGYRVFDGNISGDRGAKSSLFSKFEIAGKNPPATPDIVIVRDGRALAVIDVKYKPAKKIPDRSEINQIMCYAARYDCEKVMIAYPAAPRDGQLFCKLGEIGQTKVYRASLNLNVQDLNSEEGRFAQSVFNAL